MSGPVPFRSRPMAMGRTAAVSTPHLLASQAAIDVLRAGGNAVDAAVTAAAACTVVQPFSSSVGGVGWATVFEQATSTTEVLQFHGAAPRSIDPGVFRPDRAGLIDWRRLEQEGRALLGSLVPGAVAGWEELLTSKGTWSLSQALQPALRWAREGIPVSELLARNLAGQAERLARWPTSARIFLPGGRPLRCGERLVQDDLAATLERIAANGAAELAQGRTGDALTRFSARHGGCVSADDLAAYRPTWHLPAVGSFRGRTVHAAPAPFGDISFLTGLHLLDSFDPFSGPSDPDYVHASVESAKLVGWERARYLGPSADPEMVAGLLAPAHTRALRERIGPRAISSPSPGRGPEDTITLAVIDSDGNAVHLMQTVGALFGTAAVAGDTGFLINSSMYFVYAGGEGANRVVPGEPVEQNPCVGVVLDAEGRLELVIGSPGGKTRVETVRQMLVNVVDFKMNVQEAVDAARFLTSADGISVDFEDLTGPPDPALRAALEGRGHRVAVGGETFGSGQAVAVDPATGTRMAGADWRLESVALAY
jgi:gamma-glutamyltranspeptidase/glutathione hydrolase